MSIPIAHEKLLSRIPDGAEVHNRRSDTWGVVLGWQELHGRRVRCHVQPLPKWSGHLPRETWWDTANLSEYREQAKAGR